MPHAPSQRANLADAPGLGRLAVSIVWLGALFLSSPLFAQEAPRWSVTPYLWATDTTVDLSVGDTSLGGGEVSFDDVSWVGKE